jgi:transcriptional regulator with XRE-family HTH domain
MNTTTRNQPELNNLGLHLSAARARLKLTQRQLSSRCRIDQATIVRIERGIRLPTVPQLVQLARALDVSLQWFLTGCNWPDLEPPGLAVELRHLGIVDLLVSDAVVPGAFRPPEQVVAQSVRGDEPEPRIIEAIPAVLAWNDWHARLLHAYASADKRTLRRVAWLADIALTIDKHYRFPSGCPGRPHLSRFLRKARQKEVGTNVPGPADGLGRPAATGTLPPVWKRWGISYDGGLEAFRQRAEHLSTLSPDHSRAGRHD